MRPSSRPELCACSLTLRRFEDTGRALFKDVGDRRGQLFLWLLPARLEVFLPVLRPRTAVVVDEPGIGRGDLLGPAIGIVDVAQALDEVVPAIGIVRRRAAGEAVGRPHWRDEGLRIVKDRLVIETDEPAGGIESRLEGLDRFHLVAVLEIGVRQLPGLNVGGPGDERGAIPESDRLAV